jgi:hypothetical protein
MRQAHHRLCASICKERPSPDPRNTRENFPMLLASTTSLLGVAGVSAMATIAIDG